MANYTLGKDYTISGLEGVSDLTWTQSAEKIDVTTRKGTKPYKLNIPGLPDKTLEATVYGQKTEGGEFEIGELKTVTLKGGASLSVIILEANRSEPQAGMVQYTLKMRPAEEASDQTAPV